MTKMILAGLAALAIAGAPAAAQQKIPVQFAKGTSSATIKSSIKGDAYKDYSVAAKAGQTLTVTLKASNSANYFNILPPGSNDVAVYNSSMDGNSFKGPVPGNGATTVRVYLMRAAGRRGESSNYTLTIGVTGAAAAASHDALVAGTDYNATATIRCASTPTLPPGNCKAGVKRMAGGRASVHVDTPDGGQRTITFVNGQASSSDASAPLRVQRSGDTQTVRIGEFEMYVIPDAFVTGG